MVRGDQRATGPACKRSLERLDGQSVQPLLRGGDDRIPSSRSAPIESIERRKTASPSGAGGLTDSPSAA
jgi:hypothetical protein